MRKYQYNIFLKRNLIKKSLFKTHYSSNPDSMKKIFSVKKFFWLTFKNINLKNRRSPVRKGSKIQFVIYGQNYAPSRFKFIDKRGKTTCSGVFSVEGKAV